MQAMSSSSESIVNIPVNTIEQSLLRQLPGCWGCKDKDSVFRYVNQEYAELIGYDSPEACIGKTDFEMASLPRSVRKSFENKINTWLKLASR